MQILKELPRLNDARSGCRSWPDRHFMQEYHSRPVILRFMQEYHSKWLSRPLLRKCGECPLIGFFPQPLKPPTHSYGPRLRKSPRVKPTHGAPAKTVLARLFVIWSGRISIL